MEFRILGPLEVRDGERSLPLGGRKQRALLALLLLHANEVVSTDRLIDKLWGDRPPDTVTTVVHVYVSRLRKALGREAIVTRPPGYLVSVGPGELDLDRLKSSPPQEATRSQPERPPRRPRHSAVPSRSGAAPPSPMSPTSRSCTPKWHGSERSGSPASKSG